MTSNSTINHKTSLLSLAVGVFMLSLLLYCYLAPTIGFAMGLAIGRCLFVGCIAASLATVWLIWRRSVISAKAIGWGVLLTALAVVVAIVIQDHSYDGMLYHQSITVELMEGWNPLEGSPVVANPYVSHYAKGMETAGAVVASCFGLVEAGKAVNLLLVMGSGCVVYAFLKRFYGLKGLKNTLLTLFAIGNPVGMGQALTTYNDFACYYYILLTIIALAWTEGKMSKWLVVSLGGIIIMSCATKFTAFFYEGVALFAAFAWLVYRNQAKFVFRVALISLLISVVACLVVCYHPYVTNYQVAGHPFYPLMGEGAIDIMTSNTPDEILVNDRFTNFFKSILTVGQPKLDQRLGGFGPLMAIILALSLILIINKSLRQRKLTIYGYVALWAVVSCFIFEQSWWARYVPFLWLTGVCGILSTIDEKGWKMWLRRMVLWSGIFTAFIYLAPQVYLGLRLNVARHYVKDLSEETTVRVIRVTPAIRRHLEEQSIDYVEVETAPEKSIPVSYLFKFGADDNSNVYFDQSKAGELAERFTQGSVAKIFLLKQFVPSDLIP